MPNPPTEIPGSISTTNGLRDAFNDRIRTILEWLTGFLENPADRDLDMANQRIVNLADPRDDQDGVNLRTLKKFPAQVGAAVQGVVNVYYGIIWTLDDVAVTGADTPAYGVMKGRDGVAVEVLLYTREPGGLGNLQFNWEVDGVSLLDTPVTLAAGDMGPVIVPVSVAAKLSRKSIARPIIVNGNGSAVVTCELLVKVNKQAS